MTEPSQDLLRKLPAVSKLLATEEAQELCAEFGEGMTKLKLRLSLEKLRSEIQSGARTAVPEKAEICRRIRKELRRVSAADGRRAINATGVLLHTGLGRAPFAESAVASLKIASAYSILQVDLESGGRSVREETIEQMLQELTGCDAATVVNNNAAATFMILNTVAAGREVIISRGQLIEIGGSFRMPDVMQQSGAVLREVGTTNRTHVKDYQRAVTPQTGAILYVHPSNFAIHGFAHTPSLEELGVVAREHNLPLIADLGSGALFPLEHYGLTGLTTIGQALAAGAAITCSSGDKLICGPQAGIICGSRSIVESLRKSPFARMFRVGKMTLSSLEATLVHYVNRDHEREIPLYRMLSRPLEELENDGRRLLELLAGEGSIQAELCGDFAYVGGGSLPDEAVPSRVVRLQCREPQQRKRFSEDFSKALRCTVPPVFCRVKDQALLFDMRSLLPGELNLLAERIRAVLAELAA